MGTVYVISVSGPKSYTLDGRVKSLMSKTQMNTQMYQIIGIDKETLDFQTFAIDGTHVDRFLLDKRAGQSILIGCNQQLHP